MPAKGAFHGETFAVLRAAVDSVVKFDNGKPLQKSARARAFHGGTLAHSAGCKDSGGLRSAKFQRGNVASKSARSGRRGELRRAVARIPELDLFVPARDDFAHYCAEILARVGAVRVRRMFGGHGLYVDGAFIAIVFSETLYLKVDEQTVREFQSGGCAPFQYAARGRAITLQFWSAPAEALDSAALMEPWGRLALAAAVRASGRSKGSRRPAEKRHSRRP